MPGPGRDGRATPAPALDDRRLERGLLDLAGVLLTGTTVESMLESVTAVALTALPGCDAASVTVVREGRLSTPVSSAEAAADLDRAQYAARRGPCIEAVQRLDVVRVDSFARDDRWPELAGTAAAGGIAGSLCVPLTVADEALGALNLYSRHERALADAGRQARRLGRQASVTLANAYALQRAELLARQLAQALENRDVIGQAKGIIMAAQGLSPDQAFDVLRRASQRSNRKLSEVARAIVDRRNADSSRDGLAG